MNSKKGKKEKKKQRRIKKNAQHVHLHTASRTKQNVHIHRIAKIFTNTTSTTNIHIHDFKRYSTSWTHYNQTTPARHTKQGKKNLEIIITLEIITITTNNINIQFDHSIQSPISSIHFQHTNTFTSNNIHVSEVHCESTFEPGGSGLPYYCTPPVCVPAVLCALAVWRLATKTKKMEKGEVVGHHWEEVCKHLSGNLKAEAMRSCLGQLASSSLNLSTLTDCADAQSIRNIFKLGESGRPCHFCPGGPDYMFH